MTQNLVDLLRAFTAADERLLIRARLRSPVGDIEGDFVGHAAYRRGRCASGPARDLGDNEALEP